MGKYTTLRALISIHAPIPGATIIKDRYNLTGEISIHAPIPGATKKRMQERNIDVEFQSTLPYRERPDGNSKNHRNYKNISNHAPIPGATYLYSLWVYCFTISIHAPIPGATNTQQRDNRRIYDFNPRSHTGSDQMLKSIYRRG